MASLPDPYLNLLFRLDVGEKAFADFSECTGLASEVGTEEYHEGGENGFVHRVPTAGQPPPLVLKRGMTASRALWDWFAEYLDNGEVTLRSGTVKLFDSADRDGRPVKAWSFTGGYPAKWTGPELNAGSAAVAFEALEIVHRGIRAVDP